MVIFQYDFTALLALLLMLVILRIMQYLYLVLIMLAQSNTQFSLRPRVGRVGRRRYYCRRFLTAFEGGVFSLLFELPPRTGRCE